MPAAAASLDGEMDDGRVEDGEEGLGDGFRDGEEAGTEPGYGNDGSEHVHSRLCASRLRLRGIIALGSGCWYGFPRSRE